MDDMKKGDRITWRFKRHNMGSEISIIKKPGHFVKYIGDDFAEIKLIGNTKSSVKYRDEISRVHSK